MSVMVNQLVSPEVGPIRPAEVVMGEVVRGALHGAAMTTTNTRGKPSAKPRPRPWARIRHDDQNEKSPPTTFPQVEGHFLSVGDTGFEPVSSLSCVTAADLRFHASDLRLCQTVARNLPERNGKKW